MKEKDEDGSLEADVQELIVEASKVPAADPRNMKVRGNLRPERTISGHKNPRTVAGLQRSILMSAMRLFFVYRTRTVQ